jgi:two-component system response regulator GlrR
MSDNRSSLDASATGTGGALAASSSSASSDLSTSATTVGHTPSGPAAEPRPGRRRSDRIILASAATQQAVDQASSVARANTAVLIEGSAGTGRRHLARAIHAWSQRAGGPLVHFSAGGVAEGLQARDLFGATASADPLSAGGGDGAEGALAAAASGSVIVERVDLLSDPVRDRFVEALRSGAFTRDGASSPVPMNARVLATAEPGGASVFGDLPLQRIELAPLSERREDVLPLAAHFLAEFAEEEGLAAVGFTVDARRWLVEEPWSGNVRELRERIRQAVGLAGSGSISAEALMLSSEGDEVPSFKEAKRAFETRYVEGLLRRCSGNISRAARLAKKDRKDFYDVIRRTGVDPTRFRT